MSTTIPITTDTLLGNVPKLDIEGANWVIFSLRFQTAVEAKELWLHFDGTSQCPVGPTVTVADGTETVSPLDPNELAKWQKSKNMVKHLLTQQIPDSTTLQVHSLTTIVAMWNEIVPTFDPEEEGAFSAIALNDLNELQIPDLLSVSDDNEEERLRYTSSKEDMFSEVGDDGESLPPSDNTCPDQTPSQL
ncbi:hypothetical protein PISMIDRAFT_18132 [Pisolithus microcarpus 441]|uniref:Uncharacterized protein n=1 Tax=Pisolithus microcarpus 441 TaxID=765257 RepID=A0A0C9YSD2_9AGAM|nr:hypothetical protein PISMIDRAFT_18132 [Pisolithus microcarpus 441]